jgi:DNA sulfur modification protein DndB
MLPANMASPSVPIQFIEVSQGSRKFLLARIPAGRLTQISYVAVRGVDEEEGAVQRVLNRARISSVRDFALSVGVFPNSLVLNWNSRKNKLVRKGGNLVFKNQERSAQLIDGQHRLEGIREAILARPALHDLQIPVAIYENLTTKECADIFLSINTEQKPVPRSLVFDLYGEASEAIIDPAAVRATDIASYLNEATDSPYRDSIKFPGHPRRKGGIALSTAVSALKPLVEDKGLFEQLGVKELESQRQIVLNFFVALSSCIGNSWDDRDNAFQYAAGFAGAVDFLRLKILPHCNTKRSYKVKTIKDTLEFADLILQSEVKGLGGKNAPKTIYDRLVSAFRPVVAGPAAKFEI